MRICICAHALRIGMWLACLLATVTARGASFVKVDYLLNDKSLGSVVYTGRDGSGDSDPLRYWKLITSPPEIGEIKVSPDHPEGKSATLKGSILLSLTIRNSISMGMIELDSLLLVRDETGSNRWYVPDKEYQRIRDIVKKRLKGTMTVQYYVKGYDKLAQMVCYTPDDEDPAAYWQRLGQIPRVVDFAVIKPDQPGGLTATLRDKVEIELDPRPYVKLGGNGRYPGQVEVEELKLMRDRADTDRWYLPPEEVKRVVELAVGKKGKL